MVARRAALAPRPSSPLGAGAGLPTRSVGSNVAEAIAAAKRIGVDIESDCQWQMFGMEDLAVGGVAKPIHEINTMFRQVARMFATDKKATREWTPEDEDKAALLYRSLIEKRERVTADMRALPQRFKHERERNGEISPHKWPKVSPEFVGFAKRKWPGYDIALRTSECTGAQKL